MNIRFTIEEENIIAIYAEDSRETTLENILAAMPYMDEDMRQLAAAAVKKLDEYKKQAAQQPKDKQKEQKKELEV